jgi:Zn-finger nucleic acid-binding protein
MKDLNKITKNWFQKNILKYYGEPQLKKNPIEPKIEWVEKKIPFEKIDVYFEKTKGNLQNWVYIVLFCIFSSIIIPYYYFYDLTKIISIVGLILFGFSFLIIGKIKFCKTKLVKKKRTTTDYRIEKTKVEIPQYKEERNNDGWAIKNIGKGKLDFHVSEIGEDKYLFGVNFKEFVNSYSIPYISKEKEFMKEFYAIEDSLKQTPFVLDGKKEDFKIVDDSGDEIDLSLCGLEKDIMNHFISTEELFSKISKNDFKISLINYHSIKQFLHNSTEQSDFEDIDFVNEIERVQELDEFCTNWREKFNTWNTVLKETRYNSVMKDVIPEFTQFSNISHYSSFNFYCPYCNKEIETDLLNRDYSVHSAEDFSPKRFSQNTRCFYLLDINAWQCPMCEKVTLNPIPLHKTLDEILFPVYDNLMDENKTVREKDYSDVRKKEIHYQNEMKKELESMYFSNLDSILKLKDNMEQMHAEIDGESEAIEYIKMSIEKYKKLESQIINSIERDNEAIKMQIQETAQKILADVDRIKDREMELLSNELNKLSRAKRLDDERRDSIQREILSANQEQNQIIETGFNKVTDSVNTLNETTKEGHQRISGDINQLNETTKSGSEKVANQIKTNNAMQIARNRAMGIDSFNDNSILRPGRKIKRAFIDVGDKLVGKSSIESDRKKLDTLSN